MLVIKLQLQQVVNMSPKA